MPFIKLLISFFSSKAFMIIASIGSAFVVGFFKPWEYFKEDPVHDTSIVTIEKIKQAAKLVVYEVELNHVIYRSKTSRSKEIILIVAPAEMSFGLDFGDKNTKIDAQGDTVVVSSELKLIHSKIITDSVMSCNDQSITTLFVGSQFPNLKDSLEKSMLRRHLAEVRKSALHYGTAYAERHLSRLVGKPVILKLE